MFNRPSASLLRQPDPQPLVPPLPDSLIGSQGSPIPVGLPIKPQLGERMDGARISIIGNDLSIIGERIVIVTKGTLQVDGDVQADLHGAEVIIGEAGKVTGTICADTVEVRGQVFGTIKGTKVQLMGKSTVEGDIHHQTLVVREGANFDGRVRRPTDLSVLKPNLDPNGHTTVHNLAAA